MTTHSLKIPLLDLFGMYIYSQTFKLYPQECKRNPELAKTNLKGVTSVRLEGTRSTAVSFMRVQVP